MWSRLFPAGLFPAMILCCAARAQFTRSLPAETSLAFDQYVQGVEAKLDWRGDPVSASGIVIKPAEGRSPIPVPSGMVHDWTAQAFIPSAKVDQALALFQDYDSYKKVFTPEVVESRLLSHQGNHWKAFLKLRRKKVVTAVLDSEYDVEYRQLDAGRWAVLSRSTRINEVDGNRELPPNEEHGYLWRLNAYWLLEQRDGGLYVSCRSISLTRDVPGGLAWAVLPIVRSLPKESLQATIEAVRSALLAR
jgi:hypothetical protein